MTEVLYKHTTPLCFLPDGRLVCYQYGDIFILENGQEMQRFALFKSFKERVLGRIKLISRLLRLGVRTAEAIDNTTVILSVGNILYELDINSGYYQKAFFVV